MNITYFWQILRQTDRHIDRNSGVCHSGLLILPQDCDWIRAWHVNHGFLSQQGSNFPLASFFTRRTKYPDVTPTHPLILIWFLTEPEQKRTEWFLSFGVKLKLNNLFGEIFKVSNSSSLTDVETNQERQSSAHQHLAEKLKGQSKRSLFQNIRNEIQQIGIKDPTEWKIQQNGIEVFSGLSKSYCTLLGLQNGIN